LSIQPFLHKKRPPHPGRGGEPCMNSHVVQPNRIRARSTEHRQLVQSAFEFGLELRASMRMAVCWQ
jgi:hypothetical protein